MTQRTEQRVLWAVILLCVLLGGACWYLSHAAAQRDEWIEACVDEGSTTREVCEQRARGGYHG